MQIIARFKQYRIYRKIAVSYILLVTITVSLVSYVLFSLFSSSTAKEINNNSRDMLLQTCYASDVIYDQVMNITNQLNSDNNIISFFSSSEDNKVANYLVSLKLTQIINIYPFIKYIELLDTSSDKYFSTLPIPYGETDEFKKNTMQLVQENRKKYLAFLPRKTLIDWPQKKQEVVSTLSFLLFPDYLTTPNYAIIINIDETYLNNTIDSINSASPGFNTFVMESNGTVISHTDPKYFLQDFSKEEYVRKILQSGVSQGSFIQNIDGEKNLITYAKSQNMNWYFISTKPYRYLLQNLYQLRNITLANVLMLIVAGFFISTLLTRNLYNPIKSLLEKIKPLNRNENAAVYSLDEYKLITEAFSKSQEIADNVKMSIYRSSKLVREKYLINLLKGTLESLNASGTILEEYGIQLTGPYFSVILLKIDKFERFKESNNPIDQSLFRFAACNIVQELLAKHGCTDVLITEEDEMVALMQLPDNWLKEEVILSIVESQEAIKNYYGFTISASIGETVPAVNQLSVSYNSAQEYVRYRLYYGYESIIDYQKISVNMESNGRYPHMIEGKLIDALHMGNQPMIINTIHEFMNYVSDKNFYQTITYVNQLLLCIFRHFENMLGVYDGYFKDYLETAGHIEKNETIAEMEDHITGFCIKIWAQIDEKNSSFITQKHKQVTEEAQEYARKHFSDPALCLEIVAENAALSPGYLRKLFKSITNMSFSDYLNMVRLEKAKELLLTTNYPVSVIGEKVGILNVTYFSTMFRKASGMTPSQYRSQNALK